MSLITSNVTLNTYINRYKTSITTNSFTTKAITSKTSKVEDTIIGYSSELKTLFCLEYSTNLTNNNYLAHLKKKHLGIYNSYKEGDLLGRLSTKVEELDYYPTLEDLRIELGYNRYLFRELPLVLGNFKCRDCFYININREKVRKHYNKEHTSSS